jgi:hypothetical protein
MEALHLWTAAARAEIAVAGWNTSTPAVRFAPTPHRLVCAKLGRPRSKLRTRKFVPRRSSAVRRGEPVPNAPRSFTVVLFRRAYPNLIHYNKVAKGGHFAAWEQPELFTKELRAGFKSLRK